MLKTNVLKNNNLDPLEISVHGHGGSFTVNKFGEGEATTAFRTIYTNMSNADFPYKIDENEKMEISSTSGSDTGQKIRVSYVEYVDGDWIYKEGIAITNGTTAVQVDEVDEDDVVVGDANIMIPYRLRNDGLAVSPVSLSGGLVGEITLETLDGAGDTYLKIVNGNNSSKACVYPIATGFTGQIFGIGRYSSDKTKVATFHYTAIPYGKPRRVERIVTLTEDSKFETFPVPYTFPEKTILEVQGKLSVAGDTIGAYWDMTVIPTSQL